METNPEIEALDAVCGAIDGIDVAGSSNDDLLGILQRAGRLASRVAALVVSAAGEVDARSTNCPVPDSLARSSGCRNATELLQRCTLVSARTARSWIRLAARTRPQMSLVGEQLPPRHEFVAEGLASGNLVLESALLISDTLERSRGASVGDLEVAERCLVQAASGIDLGVESGPGIAEHADNVRIMCRAWEQALDPDGAEPDDETALRHRSLRLGSEKHGLVSIAGLVLPEVAATLGRIFDAVGSPRVAVEGEPGDDRVAAAADMRNPGQKRHDIFAMALNIAAQSTDIPLLGGAPITVVVQVSAEDAKRGSGAGWLHGHDGAVVPISQNAVRHGACAGAIQYMEQDSRGRMVSLSSPARIFNANQRRAIMVRDGGCVIPGCTVPAAWCEIHHVEPHARGGPTHIDNGVMLCFFHHRTIDSGGWKVRMHAGVPEVMAPRWLDREQNWRRAGRSGYYLTV